MDFALDLFLYGVVIFGVLATYLLLRTFAPPPKR